MTEGTHEITVQENKKHITKDLFCDWQAGNLKPPEEESFLGHIGTCTYCGEQFGNWMEEGVAPAALLSEPPVYLKEEILRRTRQMDVQAAIYMRETSRRMQLILYSLKVGVAVTASIFLLMATTSVQNMDFAPDQAARMRERESQRAEPGITDTLKQKSGEVSNLLNSLSNGLFRIETEETGQDEIRR